MADASQSHKLQTSRERERILRDLIDHIAKEKNYKNPEVVIKAITSEGANYTSVLFLVTLNGHNGNSIRLFAKVASVGEHMRSLFNASRLYYLEVFFYTNLASIYRELETRNNVADEHRFVYPEFYGCNRKELEETVVLEDLVARGYQSYNRFQSIDWDYAAASVEALAKFHALSFAYQKEKPEEFAKVCEDLKFFRLDDISPEMKQAWDKIVADKVSVLREESRAKVLRFLESVGDDAFVKMKRTVRVPVICHGDYRASNLMYKKEGDKILAIPVDYQTIHSGCAVSDLIYYEMLGSDAAFRAAHHDRLVDYYYQQLGAALQRLNVDVNEVYPRSTLDAEMRDRLPYSILLALTVLPIVLVEKENAPSFEGSFSVEDFNLPVGEVLRERFSSIVDDCERWGVI